MKKYIVAITAICTLLFSACTAQLDIPQKGVVSYETYYTTDEAAEAALVNVYAQMVQNVYGSIGNWNPYFFMVNYSADDVFAAGKNKDDHDGVRFFNELVRAGRSGDSFREVHVLIRPCRADRDLRCGEQKREMFRQTVDRHDVFARSGHVRGARIQEERHVAMMVKN